MADKTETECLTKLETVAEGLFHAGPQYAIMSRNGRTAAWRNRWKAVQRAWLYMV